MADPSSVSTITVGEYKFKALSTQVGISTHDDEYGIPMMGSIRMLVDITANLHDTDALPFSVVSGLFELANRVTRAKVQPIKIEYWKDELRQDAILTYSFEGWLSSFTTTSGTGSNHELHIRIQPTLDQQQFIKIALGN